MRTGGEHACRDAAMGHARHVAQQRLPSRQVEGYRLAATDADWTRGEGPEVAGPISAILLLLTGRTVALEQLTGAGADALRAAVARSA